LASVNEDSTLNLILSGSEEITKAGTDTYKTTIFKKGASSVEQNGALDAGTYTAHIEGQGVYAGSNIDIDFTVNALDLSKATIELDKDTVAKISNTNNIPTSVKTVNGITVGTSSANELANINTKDSVTLEYADTTKVRPSTNEVGQWVYRVVPSKSGSTNIINSQDITVVRYGSDATFAYTGDKKNDSSTNSSTLYDSSDLSTTDYKLDLSKLTVKDGSSSTAKDVPYTIEYQRFTDTGTPTGSDDKYEKVTEAETVAAGFYKAIVTASTTDNSYGGTYTIYYHVAGTTINTSQIFLTYAGTTAKSFTDVYQGKDLLGDITITARDTTGKAVDASDLKIVVTKDGKEVTEIKDAGTYTLTVKAKDGTKYVISDGSTGTTGEATFTVNKVVTAATTAQPTNNANVRLAGAPTLASQESTYAYTGSAIVPTFEYDVTATYTNDYSKKTEWTELPTSAYTLTYYKAKAVDASEATTSSVALKNNTYVSGEINNRTYYFKAESGTTGTAPTTESYVTISISGTDNYFKISDAVSESEATTTTTTTKDGYVLVDGTYYSTAKTNKVDSAKDAGTYLAVLADADTKDNYTVGNTVVFTISDSKYFIDVPVGTWYYDTVYKAASLGYMTGYDGTKYFGPNDNLTRAQAVVVLYKMAHETDAGEADAWNSTEYSYASQFADVDQSGWYAQALGWAVKAGIVTGTSSTTFEPLRDVTREEFALMLQRYAKANNDDVTADASVLKTYADANAVDSWATDGVAWAVSNKIAGVDTAVLDPKGTITRAQVAAMAVRYQPEKTSTIEL
jgi:hypothetical protein